VVERLHLGAVDDVSLLTEEWEGFSLSEGRLVGPAAGLPLLLAVRQRGVTGFATGKMKTFARHVCLSAPYARAVAKGGRRGNWDGQRTG